MEMATESPVMSLTLEGVDASGREVTKFVPNVPLKKSDVIQILIGETHDAGLTMRAAPNGRRGVVVAIGAPRYPSGTTRPR